MYVIFLTKLSEAGELCDCHYCRVEGNSWPSTSTRVVGPRGLSGLWNPASSGWASFWVSSCYSSSFSISNVEKVSIFFRRIFLNSLFSTRIISLSHCTFYSCVVKIAITKLYDNIAFFLVFSLKSSKLLSVHVKQNVTIKNILKIWKKTVSDRESTS